MRKKLMGSILVVMILMGSIAPVTNVSAKTLAESFSGGSHYIEEYSSSIGMVYVRKMSEAKTKGYYKSHYVRAYIGGTSSSAVGADADTGRRFSNGDITVSCKTIRIHVPRNGRYYQYFKRAYAKYGTK